jgi:hypothetical protein
MTIIIAILCKHGLLLVADKTTANSKTGQLSDTCKLGIICKNGAAFSVSNDVDFVDGNNQVIFSAYDEIQTTLKNKNMNTSVPMDIQSTLVACFNTLQVCNTFYVAYVQLYGAFHKSMD